MKQAPPSRVHTDALAALASIDLGESKGCREALHKIVTGPSSEFAKLGVAAVGACSVSCPSDIRSHRASSKAAVLASILAECGDPDPVFGHAPARSSMDPIAYVLLRSRFERLQEGLGEDGVHAWDRWKPELTRIALAATMELPKERPADPPVAPPAPAAPQVPGPRGAPERPQDPPPTQ